MKNKNGTVEQGRQAVDGEERANLKFSKTNTDWRTEENHPLTRWAHPGAVGESSAIFCWLLLLSYRYSSCLKI